jgi:hypothetical protein
MCPPATPLRLIALHDQVAQGVALDRQECKEVARGFVNCNATARVVEFLHHLANGIPIPAAFPVTYQELSRWLNATATPAPAVLVAAAAVADINQNRFRGLPWEANVHWLVIESCLRLLGASPGVTALGHADEVYRQALTVQGQMRRPCYRVSRGVAGGRSEWGTALAAHVTDWWPRVKYLLVPRVTRRWIGAVLAPRLWEAAGELLTDVVRAQMRQLDACVRARNQRYPHPPSLPHGWQQDLLGRLLDAVRFGDEFRITGGEHARLALLHSWLTTTPGLWTHFQQWLAAQPPRPAPLNPALPRLTAVAGHAHNADPWPPHAAEELLAELDAVFGFIPRRGLPRPPGWSFFRPVQHLFSYPLHPAFDFGKWRALMTQYGM